MKKVIPILLALVILFHISACRKDDADNNDADGDSTNDIRVISGVDDFDIEKHIYLSREIDVNEFEDLRDPVSGVIAHGDFIVCWYQEFYDIIILKFTSDGNNRHMTRFQGPDGLYQVKSLSISDDGHFSMIAITSDGDGEVTINYLIYDQQGEETARQDLLTIPKYFDSFTQVKHAVITNNNIVVVTETDSNQTIYLFTKDGEKLGEIYATTLIGVARLQDDRVVALFTEGASSFLREVDFSTGGWGETHQLDVNNAEQLITSDTTPYYDFFINVGGYLVGYVLETDSQTTLINWIESGVAVTWQHQIGMLTNKDIFALHSGYVPTVGRSGVFTEFAVLSRSLRFDSVQQRTVITLGGLYIGADLRAEIVRFNSENPDYQIEIREYHSADLDFEANLLRMNVELMAGRGPDIIVDSNFGENTGFMADLYTFIDADPVISRSDFFPNVLRALERSGGNLPFISNTFVIMTMLAKRETAEMLTPFTYDTILQYFDESDPYSLAGQWLTGRFFISKAIYNSGSFIDWDNKQADIDNNEFAKMLEIAARLPDDYTSANINLNEEYKRLHNGNQLLLEIIISDPDRYRTVKTQIGDIVVVGEPTLSGGQSKVHIMGSVGIYAMSPNQEAAWSFVRRLLLPEAKFETGTAALPLRIDVFEKQVAELMEQEFWEEDFPMVGAVAGEEKPKFYIGSGLTGIPIYAMTEEEALEIRSIIESATVGTRSDSTVWMIVDEEFQNFKNGLRSSADTARIIQNRVQIYFDEQG